VVSVVTDDLHSTTRQHVYVRASPMLMTSQIVLPTIVVLAFAIPWVDGALNRASSDVRQTCRTVVQGMGA
jgi:hypothetical protein